MQCSLHAADCLKYDVTIPPSFIFFIFLNAQQPTERATDSMKIARGKFLTTLLSHSLDSQQFNYQFPKTTNFHRLPSSTSSYSLVSVMHYNIIHIHRDVIC